MLRLFVSFASRPLFARRIIACVALAMAVAGTLASPLGAAPRIIYVAADSAAASPTGVSWATACPSLQTALDAAGTPTAEAPVEIWIKTGVYKPTSGTDRSAAFRLKSHLTLRGGFRGDETTTSERTPWGNPTILSGDIGVPMVGAITALNPEPAQLPSTLDAGWADNCHNVLVGEGVTGVTLEFLTITGGSATDTAIDATDIDGFEMYSADPYEEGAKSIVKPSSTVVGGGLFFTTGKTWTVARYGLQMYDCTFARNRARGYGGAVGVYDASAFIGGCSFEGNVSDGPAGAFWGLNQQSGFVQCSFTDNTAADGGGAVKIMGIPSARSSDATVDGFSDTLRGVAFSIFGVTEEQTRQNVGYMLTSYGIYKAANKFAAAEGGFFARAGATIPNPFVRSTTNVGGSIVQDTRISPATRALSVYALVQIAVGVGDNIVKILDAFGKIDHDDQNYKNWVSFNTNFNKYATPQGLLSLGSHAVINAALPDARPDLIAAKKSGYTFYTQAGRSGFASCSFTGNKAGNEGGAIELVYNNLLVENCRFERNSAAKNGGAISSALWNMPQVISSVFAHNTSADGTSALSNAFNSLMMVVNCTIINNRSSDPLGKAVTAAMGADVRIYNSILWGNGNASVRSGADVEAVTEDMLDENARMRYDVLQGERVNWLGYMDIRNSIIQSLDTLPLGTDRVAPRLAGVNLSQSEINAAIALTKDADARGELESTGAVNVGAGIREKVRDPAYGNSAADPMLLSSPVGKTSGLSPATNAGNNQWITWKMISHAVASADIMDVAGGKRILNSRVDIGAYETDNTLPDSAPLVGAEVGAGASENPEASGVGAATIPAISPTTPPNTVVYYVKPAAVGDGSGSSWANATNDLQGAISHPNAEVWVAAGIYKPTSGADRTLSFSLADGVKVFGGFAGGEATRGERNWKTNTTVIGGDIGSPGVASDNSKNLFRNAGLTSSAVLDGFTLQDANSSDADGGAMLNIDAAPLIQNCVFRNNHARNGGAIYSSGVGDAGPVLVNCEFRDNSAELAGGAVGYTHSLLGHNLIFSGNTAGTGGGAISVSGGGASQYCTIQNSLFYGNASTAAAGGAIASSGLYLNVVNSTFYGNTATIDSHERSGGGAIDDGYSSPSGLASALIVNSIFYKNTAANQGGGGRQTLEKQQIRTAGGVRLSHSLVQGLNSYAGNIGDANFGGDPQFVAEGVDFHLKDTSLAIDSGDATTAYTQTLTADLDGGSRTVNGTMDLGPYEHGATAAHPVKRVAETSVGTESFTFIAAYTATLGDTLRWQVDRGDGLGYVPLTEGEENTGVFTATLTVSSRPNGFSYRLRVVRNGVTYFSPVATLEPTAASMFKYVYVKPVATGDGSGTSWANATSDLRGAVGQPGAEVWVAAGTYKATSGTDRDISFSLGSATKVYGGFIGTETKLEARDWRANQTIISGEIGGAGVEDNTRHLVRNTGVGNSAVLDGFYLQDAYADGVDGGAILNVNSNPAIRNCVFESNHARNGGAICSTGTDLIGFGSKVFNCEFRGNSAELAGGAIHFDGSWAGANLLFKDNTAPTGGAVYSTGNEDGQNVTVQNALFTGNLATGGVGGAVWADGLSFYVINSTLYANQAMVDSANAAAGGAIAFDRAASNTATLGIYNSILYKNRALNNGAGGRDSVENQQLSLSADSLAGVNSSLVQGLQTYTGSGNFDGDPVFVNEGTDFHVANTSPTIDSGTLDAISSRLETTDLDGSNRVIGVIDLGPYEHAATPANPIRKITASSSGLESYSYTAADYGPQAGDTLQWYVDRGDGDGFVALGANDSGQDALPDEYLGLNTASLTVLSPPSGFLFRLKLVRAGVTYYSPVSRLSPTALSRTVYFYVRPEATGDGSGSGWANATNDLQAAISQPNAQVWVQEGTYYPTSGTDRDVSFSLARGVRVYGGFRGTESVRDARNPSGHPTRISGNIGSPSDAQDNSRHLFRNEDIGASTILDGFTLENAYADGEDGGAILNVSASPTIQNCVFRNNHARNGGAIASTGTPPFLFGSDLVDCRFENNTAELTGGAISYHGSLSAVNVVFDGNEANAGGAMNFDGNSAGLSATVRNGLFLDNRAVNGRGGAIFSQGLSLWIENSTFHGNQATLASASPLGGGAIHQDHTSYGAYTVEVYSSIFYGNAAVNSGSGGLASLEYQQVAVKGGGGIYASHSLIQGLNRYANIAALANFDEDPRFVDAGNGNFHLSNVSPAINSGVASEGGSFLLADTDLEGNARVHLGAVDLGPYEYAGSAALGRITSSSDFSSGTLRFFKTAGFAVQAGDVLRWQVDRGDGNGFVFLDADGVYSGVDSATLSITSPPSSENGYRFRLQVVRGADTLTTLPAQLTLPLSRIYVDASRLEMTADGASWSTAYGSLADALKASGPGSVLWVAGGTYLPTSGSDANAAFRIPPGVSVYGGFPAFASSSSQRNPAAHPSILSGKLNGATSRLAYSRHVVVNQGALDRTTLLDGFVLEDAYSSLMLNDGASPTLRNCVFRDNDSSGAGDGYGAAISNINGANPLIAECRFLGNTAVYAGALYLSGASATVENSVFARNHASASGGAIFVRHGSLSLVHCTVADNTSQGTVAALYAEAGVVTVANSIFWNNTTSYAGWTTYDRAIRTQGGSLTFSHSCVEGGASLPATNLAYDPIFDPSRGGDYALAPYSPLVNAASADATVSSAMDIAGNPRVHEAAPDLGAYELQIEATAAVPLTALPRSRVVYNIGGTVDFTVSWPAGSTLNPSWYLLDANSTPLDPSRYTFITGSGFSTVRVKDISLADTGLAVSFTDDDRGVNSVPPAVLTVREPRIVRVNPAATGNNDGTSWTNAYTDLITALNNAQTADEIWVAGGTYTAGGASYFNLGSAVSLYGGFAGAETTRGERDPVLHPTRLHAVGSNPVLYGVTPESDSGMAATVDGFIVENSTGPAVVMNVGVGVTYRNCVFRNNAGYIGNFQSQVQYEHCEFTGNTGNLFISDRSTVTFVDCNVHHNTTTVDLMTSNNHSTVVFGDTVVSGNTVAGALFRNSGGAAGGSSLTVLRSSFRENTTGGAVIDNSSVGTCAIESSLFAGNVASASFATVQNSGALSIVLSTFADNRGGWFGGGLATYSTSVASINSCIFWGNRGARANATIEAQQVGDGSGALTVGQSIIEGLSTFTVADDHNTAYYPLFANPAAGDYHLLANSPAIDTAKSHLSLTSVLDLDKAPRPTVYGDAGAYEFPGTPDTPLMISTYPSSITTTETTTTGFTIVAPAFSGYHWQYFDGTNWVDVTNTSEHQVINSETSDTSTLRFDSPSFALNGARYRLILTTAGITYTTGDLILTVNRPRVLHVNGAVSVSGDGGSWATAFKTVQEALAVTDENAEIWVQAGTYAISTASLRWNVHLYGGFAGDETQRDQRDWATNVVTLLGNGKRIFSNSDPVGQKTSHAVLDGFTLAGATSQTAVFLDNSDAVIRNCTFRENASAIGVSGHSNPVITHCMFESHTATVLVFDGDSGTVNGCTFRNNSDLSVGAGGEVIYIYRGDVTITDSTFTGNASSGGVVVATGDFDATSAANVAAGKVTQLTMSRCRLTGNTAYAGLFATQVLLNLDNSLVAQNTFTGSALWGFSRCRFNLTNVTVADNTGTFDCAGIQCDGAWTLKNSIVWGNRTSWPYGSLLHPDSPSLVEDVQIKLTSSPSIKNSTIEGAYYTTLGGNPNGNSGYDPLFANADALDYQLSDISPAVNTGTSAGIAADTLDLASRPRLSVATPDMGAYEFTGAAGTAVRMSSNLGATTLIVGQRTSFVVRVPAEIGVQWQVNTGGSFVDVVSDGDHALSADGKTLTLNNASLAMSGNQYRFVLSGGVSYASAAGLLTVVPKPIVHVDANATGNRDGTSWTDAFVSLDDALLAASNSPTGGLCEVWVAQGTYVSGQYSAHPGMEFYGGFAGDETARSERNISARPTILTSSAGSDSRSYLLSDGYPDSARSGIVIDGFTLTGASGGIEFSTGPGIVRNCTFTDLAGHGVAVFYVSLTIEDCVFDQPGIEAVLAGPASTTIIRRSTFQAGLTASSSDDYPANVSIEDSVFQNNIAGHLGATLYVGADSTVNMIRCRVLKNHGDSAIINDGTLVIRQSLIADNFGAGIDLTYRALATRLTSVTVANNASYGIGIGWQNSSLRLTNCIIAGNHFRQQIYTDSGGVFASFTLVEGETHGGTGNQSWDPLFVNPAAGDYTLSARSPAIDAGDPAAVNSGETDLAGTARIQSATTDLGAYESATAADPLYRGPLPASVTTPRGVDGVFSITGANGYTYTWQYFNGSAWVNITFNTVTGSWEGPAGIPLIITTVNGVSTLTITQPALGASGLQFRVTIDGQGVTSDPLTLTVNEPGILYVDASIAAGGDGKTWGTAFKTVSEALAHVTPSRRILHVAAGVYKPAVNGYDIEQRVEIYGGFPAGGAAFEARDTVANRVILSGERGDPGLTADNASPVVRIDALNSPIGADTILDGITIDGGGVGISVTYNASPTLRDVIVSNNVDSGLDVTDAGARVEDCQFLGNASDSHGGGASLSSSTVTFSGCAFRGNTAQLAGGGLFISNGSVRLENTVISGNMSAGQGGGIAAFAGSHTLVNSTVVGNSSGDGGGLYVYIGSNLNVWNSIVWANRASQGTLEAQQLDKHLFGGGFNVQASDIEGLSQYAGSGSNLAVDPLFYGAIDATSAPTTTGDFHIHGGSAVVDKGDDTLLNGLAADADHAPRSVRTVDLGAYEVQGPAGDPLQITQQPADLVYEEAGTNEYHVQLAGSDYIYQWESSTNDSVFTPVVDGTDFAGSQTATLRVLTDGPAHQGQIFRVKITSPAGGTVVSRSALLGFYPSQYYVNAAAADDNGDGYTWATAFKTLGTALQEARIGPSGSVQIWVASGTYLPSETDPTVSFPLKSNVELYGGFAGIETALEQRDVAVHPTVLKGIAGSTAVFATTGTTAITGARIDGFAITTATTGVSLGRNVTLTVANCSFSGLETGIRGDTDTLTVQSCLFTGLTVAGISNADGPMNIYDCVFTENARGIEHNLVNAPFSDAILTVERSAFRGNGVSTADGGGVSLYKTGASYENCLFSGNIARTGAGIHAEEGMLVVRNCTFAGNYAEETGGGIYCTSNPGGILHVYNSILWGNACGAGGDLEAQIANVSASPHFLNNDLQGASWGGNFSVDPNFVAPVTASVVATTAGDYRLMATSPLVNNGANDERGTSATDLVQAPRTVETTVDIGAYEFPEPLLAVTGQPSDASGGIGQSGASFSVTSNAANASYQWQVSLDGGNTWTDLVESATASGVTTSTLTVSGGAAYHGRLYRAHVMSPQPGDLYSQPATYHFITATVTPATGYRNATFTGTTSTISFLVQGDALAASIADGSFAIHAMQTGRLSLAEGSLTGLTVSEDTVSLQTSVPLKAGELVEVTTTSAVKRADGYAALPTVFQFHAGTLPGNSGIFPTASAIVGAPSTATALATGDLNGDHSVDLVIGGTNGAAVWINNGAASFAATSQTLGSGAVSQARVGSLGFADSNRLDIVLLKSGGDVEIWRNEGDGSFTNTVTLTDLAATDLEIADLNGDGALDLFIATAGADQVWFNDGAGDFTDSMQRLGAGSGKSVAIADFNNDHSLDVCTVNGSGNIELWNNDGAGNFTAGPSLSSSAAERVIASDLDRDGRLEMVTVLGDGRVKIHKWYGTFYSLPGIAIIGGGNAQSLGVGDVDGDGLPDLVISAGDGSMQLWKGQGYDSYLGRMNFQQISNQPALSYAKAANLADVNDDGRMDSVFITPGGVPTVALYVATPTAPTGLTATAVSDTRIALAWTDNATTETGYSVERSPNGSNNWTVISSSLPVNSTSYIDTDRSSSTSYYYRVRCDIGGVLPSSYSNKASATTPGAIAAASDAIAVLEGATATTLVGGASSVLTNDSNPDAGTLAASVVAAPLRGALALNADGSFSYTPSAGYFGSDSFTYLATNLATGAGATASVSITVTRLNDAPDSLALTPVAGTHYTGQAAGEAVATLSATDPDPEDVGQLTFSLVSGEGSSGNADFVIAGSTLKTAAVIDASPGLTRSIRIRVTDSLGLFREQAFTVAFTQAPTASPGGFQFDEDTPFEVHLSGTGGANALDYEIVSQPSHGSLTLGANANIYLYTPDANFHGADSFTYRVLDSALGSAPVTVTLTVDPVDDVPTLDAVAPVTTVENTPVSFTLVGHDPEGDAITCQLASTPTLGSVQIDGAVVTYTPDAGVVGTETLSFTATAGGLTSAPLSVVITITPQPVALTVYRGLYDYSDVPASDGDDWSGVPPANLSSPAHGAVTLEGSRLLYRHNGDSATSDSFTYTLTNGAGDIRHVAVEITISDRVLDVTSTADSGPGTLRAAIDITNHFAADTLAPDHTDSATWLIQIVTGANSYIRTTTYSTDSADNGFSSAFRIQGHVTIDASASPNFALSIQQGSKYARNFVVPSGSSLTLKHLLILNGRADRDGFHDSTGGLVLNFGTFTAENVTFKAGQANIGAALYNAGGTVALTDCTFVDNFVMSWPNVTGSVLFSRNGTLALTHVTFADDTSLNLHVTGDGALATVNVSDSTIGAFHLATANGGTLSVTGLPYARPDAVIRPAGQPVTLALATLLANDVGGPFTSVSVDSVSAQGVTVTRDGDNLIYAAPAGLTTADTFTYTVTSEDGLTSTATVAVSIEADPYPHGTADTATVYRGLYEDIDVLANDSDDNGGTLVVSAVGTPAHGTATIENGRIRYVHDGGSSTTDTFTYSVSNGSHVTENVSVTLAIADRVLDVTSGADSGPGSLRAALEIVNRFTRAGTPRWTVRLLAGSDQTWTPTGTSTDGYPDYGSAFKIAGNVLIDAAGSPNFTLSGPDYPYGRLFLVQPGASLALANLTLANSQAVGADPGSVSLGGAVLNRGVFSATNVDFRNNTAVWGAALCNDGGTATLTDCAFFDNVSPYNSSTAVIGIVVSLHGTLTLADVSIDGYNSAPALFVWDGTLNHSGENHVASYQPLGTVTVVPGAPVAMNDTVSHVAGQPLQIALSTLLANDARHAGATLTFDGVSANGVTITRDGDFLIYDAPAYRVGDDTFTYTLTDSIGLAGTATVTVRELDPPLTLAIAARAEGGVVLTLTGEANTSYRIQVSNDLVNWSAFVIEEANAGNDFTEITEIYTDGDGHATIEDPEQPSPGSARFYRATSN